MKLVKTTIFSAFISITRIGSGFLAGKVVAIFTGLQGIATIGAFTNFITIVLTFANGAINTGIIKYTAEFEGEEAKQKLLFSTALRISVICSLATGTILLFFSNFISISIFRSIIFINPVRALGVTIIFYSLNSLLIAILNGKGQIKTYTLVNTAGSVIGLIFTLSLVFWFKITGALYALVLSQSIVFFITFFLVCKSPWFSRSHFSGSFDKILAFKLSHYSLMSIITALTLPLSQIILRNFVTSRFGIDHAGYWQGMMRISDAYLMLITTSLATYYLPKLSSLKTDLELHHEVINGYKFILPLVGMSCFFIYFMRFFLIKLLYTDAFIGMESLFFWQLLGDFFKLSAWILSYLMLAKSMTKLYIITEVLFTICYLGSSYVFVEQFGLKGIVISFSFTYLLYLLVMVIAFNKLIFMKIRIQK